MIGMRFAYYTGQTEEDRVLVNKFILLILIASIIFLAVLTPHAKAQADYQNKLIFDYNKNVLFISLEYNGSKMSTQVDCAELQENPDGIKLSGELMFSPGQIIWKDITVPYILL
ncbi:MAG: hypothetical protein GWO41_08785, partial [candidate division Zixibacteria bacterium]|nr:hypothetical protein [candidate division Zixibacteria bacterium]NIR67499.1 hypothetical protein [candidate division Zixibacteria bacterium]NIS16463.1 hypothetical protein [candidate division Zixibacteria bacterium]NIS48782.1 hypothetical protein [candidate division Zixibacteria bacterium]NIT52813.1 hypothetical protein [candidate division Zixibacteria bacterium]